MPNIEYEDKEIIKKAIDLLKDNQYIILCTVVETWGSSPRPVGSMMIISQAGKLYGSVSGGCIEDDLLDKYNNNYFSSSSLNTLTYNATTENSHVKIPCGSKLKLITEKINDAKEFISINNYLNKNLKITRTLNLTSLNSSIETSSANNENFSYSKEKLIKTFGPAWKILVIGANHITPYIKQLADMLGYKLIVCDPRKNYSENYTEEHNHKTISLMPDDAVTKYASDFYNIVLSLSHDPKLDDMALMTALELNLFYVGAIGSKKTNEARRKRLKQLGLNDTSINKLHGPVGLDINSKTPAEIAISIFADLTRLKNNYQQHESYKH